MEDSCNIEWPELTFPSAEAALLMNIYAKANVILEYGSGGSTVAAAHMRNKLIFSVESDEIWARTLQSKIDAGNLPSEAILYHADIGPTGAWGRPMDDTAWRNFYRYPLAIWVEPFFRQPDVILVDGRFRAACLVAALLQIQRPTTLLFDDYVGRKSYQVVEQLVRPVEIVGRMARFELEPCTPPIWALALMCELCTQITFATQKPEESQRHYSHIQSYILQRTKL